MLRVKPDKVEEYVAAHRDVWPEMVDTLREAGIRNYTIFRAENEVFERRPGTVVTFGQDTRRRGAFIAERKESD